MRTPADVLAELVQSDPTRPRLTVYDDSPGTGGERIELSAKVLANWVAKAANALQDEWDIGPGARVRLALPPHWRLVYWAYAVWSAGGVVVLAGADDWAAGAEVTVSDDPAVLGAVDGDGVLVTLAALARRSPDPVPAGTFDEAASIATYADRFDAYAAPTSADLALADPTGDTAYGMLVQEATASAGLPPASRVHTTTTDPSDFLRLVLAVWSGGGSVVLSRGASGIDLRDRLASEAVTVDTATG